ncbi:MAG: hypothetical protein QXI60_03760 [Thermofilaceae archaeon]
MRHDVFTIALLTYLYFILLTPVEGLITHRQVIYEKGFVNIETYTPTVCTDPQYRELVEKAVNRWNTAIIYYSIRLLYPDMLFHRLSVTEPPCNIHIRFLQRSDDGQTFIVGGMTYHNYTLEANPAVGAKLDEVLLHELGHALGLGHVYPSMKGLVPAMTFYLQAKEQEIDVTSYDFTALATLRRLGKNVEYYPSPWIPYLSLKHPWPDVANAVASTILAFITKRYFLQGLGKNETSNSHQQNFRT